MSNEVGLHQRARASFRVRRCQARPGKLAVSSHFTLHTCKQCTRQTDFRTTFVPYYTDSYVVHSGRLRQRCYWASSVNMTETRDIHLVQNASQISKHQRERHTDVEW